MSDVDSFCCFNLWFSILEFERDHVLLWPESTSSTSLNLQAILSGSPVFGAFCRAAGPGARGFPEAPEPMAEATLTWIHGWAGMKGPKGEYVGTIWNLYIVWNHFEISWKTCRRNMLSMYYCPGNRCELHVTGTLVKAIHFCRCLTSETTLGFRVDTLTILEAFLKPPWSTKLTMLTILPSSFFSPCGQSVAKTIPQTQTTLQIKSQRAVCFAVSL